MTMDDLIEYVISEDRVCPVPYKWKVVDETLRKVVDKTQSLKPPSSFILAAWGATSDRRKRARLIEQITFSHQVGKFDEIRSFLLSLNKDEWRYCPEAGLDAPTADDREMEEQEEIYDRIRQAKSFYEEFVKISGFSDSDQNKFRELLSTFMQIFLEKIDVQEKLSPINIADSTIAKIGDEVIAIGNPFGLGKTFTSGIISATGRDYGNPYLELIQTDAAINPGNSGGALLNQRGNLIGMSTNIFSKTGSYSGIGFALPANKMIEVASEIIKYGTVKRSWIGDFRVRFKRFFLNDQLTYGLEILELKDKGPLYEIGHAKQGDIIVKINDNIATWENLTGALNNSFPGDEIELKVLQNSKIKDLTLITMATGN